MVELAIPVLVTVGQRDVYEVTLPRLTDKWRGPSLATLLDDVALALMERLPREAPERMPLYLASPHVELRKVPVTLTTKRGKGEDPEVWKGRLSVVFWRWPDDKLYLATIPRLSPELFAVSTPGALEAGTHAFVAAWAEKHGSVAHAASAAHEHLELLSVEVSFPSPLPSQPRRRPSPRSSVRKKATPAPRPPVDRSVPPVTLRSVARNLSAAAQDGRLGHAYAREALLELLLPELCADSAAILLVGPTGVGKTAIVHELVHRLIARQTGVKDRTDVWQVDGNRIIAGMSVVGAWEQRLTEMVTELSARGDVLYVEDLPVLAFTGRSAHGNANVAELLAPHLERGELRVIGECTEERLAAVRDEAPGFFEHFRVVYVPELDEATTLEVLEPLVRQLVRSDEAVVSLDTLTAVLGLTRRFQGARALPGRAVSVLASLLDERVTEGVDRDALGRRKVGVPELVAHYSRRTGLPRFVLWEREARDQQALVEHFTRRIVAQPAAVEAAVDVVTLLEQGLNDPGRPLATFLFVGPTGVGKTETAKALGRVFVRLVAAIGALRHERVSDARERRAAGGRSRGARTESSRARFARSPSRVVLFDEVEKAHPAVFDALLADAGRGARVRRRWAARPTSRACVIVMTSNLGVREASARAGFSRNDPDEARRHYVRTARALLSARVLQPDRSGGGVSLARSGGRGAAGAAPARGPAGSPGARAQLGAGGGGARAGGDAHRSWLRSALRRALSAPRAGAAAGAAAGRAPGAAPRRAADAGHAGQRRRRGEAVAGLARAGGARGAAAAVHRRLGHAGRAAGVAAGGVGAAGARRRRRGARARAVHPAAAPQPG
jgi:ATP-dependent Clp protease ATP-binding subunit ClpC